MLICIVFVVTLEIVNSLPFKLLFPIASSAVVNFPAILILLFAVSPVVFAKVNVSVFSAALNTAL